MAGYIGTTPVPQATQHRESFTATGGQTSFATVGYTPQFIDVYLNGVKLAPADFTATNGSDVVLASGATASDILEIVAYTPFEIASQTFTGDTTANNFAVTGTFTSRGIDDNADAVAITIDSSENVGIGTTSPVYPLVLQAANPRLQLLGTGTNTGISGLLFGDADTATRGQINYNHSSDSLDVVVNGVERMRIDASGNLLVGKTNADSGATSGFEYNAVSDVLYATRAGTPAAFNRLSSDGDIALFRKDGSTVGSIGVAQSGDRIYLSNGGEAVGLDNSGNEFLPMTTAGADNNGAIDLGKSTSRFKDLYLSGGVVFGDAGGSGTSTSNTLDSYEEGTWTPVAADASSGGNTSTTGQGFYTKIGRLVVATCDITNINTTGLTSTNSFNVQGLPFANNGTVRSTSTLQVNLVNNGDGLFAHLSENGTSFSFKYNDDSKNNTATGLLVSDIKDDQSDMFGITLVYHTAT